MNTCNCFNSDGWRYEEYTPSDSAIPERVGTRRHLPNCPAVKETETPKSETPRTDAIAKLNFFETNKVTQLVDLSRQLERDLTTTQQRLKGMTEAAMKLAKCGEEIVESWVKALARLAKLEESK